MKFETRILTVLLCAAFALTACNKNTITPEGPTLPSVGFRTMSQATWVKSATGEFPYPDQGFGVWGIARNPQAQTPYVLWDSFTQVRKVTGSDVYAPVTNAYWVKDYTYNFLAVAPYNDAGFTLTGVTQKTSTENDKLTFAYDVSSKYAAGNHTFDLLGAAAQNTIDVGGYSTAQDLIFWHLFSQVSISATFSDCDAEGNNAVTRYVLKNVDTQTTYSLSYDAYGNLTVTCSSNGETAQMDLAKSATTAVFYLIPQDMSDIELYVDFTVTKDGKQLTAENVMIDVSTALDGKTYEYNQRYNWKLNITPKFITFDSEITVEEWDTVTGDSNPSIDL